MTETPVIPPSVTEQLTTLLCDADGNLFASEEPAFEASAEVTNRFLAELGDARRFTAEAPNTQKQITRLDGKYVVVWKRINGTWMLDSDIWNLNQ